MPGVANLARAAIATQLVHRFDHMIDAGDMGLGQQSAVGVDRQLAAQFDAAVLHEVADLAARAEPGLLQFEQRHIAETVVDHGAVHIAWLYPRLTEGSGCGLAEADFEHIGRLQRSSEHAGLACAAPLMKTGLCGMSLACSADETMEGPAAAASREQASKLDGSCI